MFCWFVDLFSSLHDAYDSRCARTSWTNRAGLYRVTGPAFDDVDADPKYLDIPLGAIVLCALYPATYSSVQQPCCVDKIVLNERRQFVASQSLASSTFMGMSVSLKKTNPIYREEHIRKTPYPTMLVVVPYRK